MSEQTEVKVIESESADRFEAYVDGELAGVADYYVDGRAIVFHHTEVEPRLRHHGVAGQLVRGALDAVAERGGLRVIPRCSYVKHWINEHPGYAELLSPPV